MHKRKKVQLPTLHRAASIEPKTLNVEKRTVDVIWTKGARVLRRGFFTDFEEELSLDKKSVRMKRLKSGTAPFLDNHGFTDARGVRSTLGVVESAELIPGKEGRATIRFSERADVEEIFRDVQQGILRNISVGYDIHSFEKVGETDGRAIFRATDWEPFELSLVPAGADPDAHVRSFNNMTEDEKKTIRVHDCYVYEPEAEPESGNEPEPEDETRNKISENEDEGLENPTKVRDTNPTGENSMTPEELAKQKEEQQKRENEIRTKALKEGQEAEALRQTEIRSICEKLSIGDEDCNKFITEGKTADEVRTLAIDIVAKKDEDPETTTRGVNTNPVVGDDLNRQGRVEGMADAILHRFRPTTEEVKNEHGQRMRMAGYKMTEAGRSYAYMSLTEMARRCLEEQGVRCDGLPKHVIADLALNNGNPVGRGFRGGLHSSSDFPEILANVINKTLRAGYLAAPQTFMPFTTEVFVSDFKEISRTNLGDAPELLKVPEGGEIERGSISEAAEKYFVEEYARIIAISRKTIVNDDLAAMTRLPERMGRRSKDLESDLVWNLIKANAAMADGNALYSAAHGNLAADHVGAPSEDAFGEFREKARRQVGLDGAKISIVPKWVYVPPALETATEKLLADTRPTQPSETNPFGPNGRSTLQMGVEPRLEDAPGGNLTAWYGFADKSQVDMIELARLEGTDGPQISTRDGFDVNGMETKILHDVGVKAIDWVGVFKNAGA